MVRSIDLPPLRSWHHGYASMTQCPHDENEIHISKLITWNLQWGRGVDGRVDLDRIVKTARDIADFDVLCVQEVADNFPGLEANDDRDQFARVRAAAARFQPRGRALGRHGG